jgi:hypothetical protein
MRNEVAGLEELLSVEKCARAMMIVYLLCRAKWCEEIFVLSVGTLLASTAPPRMTAYMKETT